MSIYHATKIYSVKRLKYVVQIILMIKKKKRLRIFLSYPVISEYYNNSYLFEIKIVSKI